MNQEQSEKYKELLTEILNKVDERSTGLMPREWAKLKLNFFSIYPNFIVKIKSSGIKLSKTEERLLMLLKLNLDTENIAQAFGVQQATINTTRYRFRRKFKLPSNVPLVDYLESQFSDQS